jgi:hypothetical protein
VTTLIWQRFTAHPATRTPHRGGRRTTARAGIRRQGEYALMAHVPRLIVREPEISWWRAQDAWDMWPEPGRPAAESDAPVITIAVVGDSETSWNTDAVVLRLAQLAAADELVVVYGHREPGHQAVLAGMRDRLPRHHIVDVQVRRPAEVRCDTGTALKRLLEEGSVAVVVTDLEATHSITAEISSRLQADRVLRVFCTPAGADLHQVWHRRPAPVVN